MKDISHIVKKYYPASKDTRYYLIDNNVFLREDINEKFECNPDFFGHSKILFDSQLEDILCGIEA